ncbi:DUF2929 family protein [Bacillaceae bacterium SIJ1]|uniref:DUF2929 family protein n=1 Tax=Litoribacterium kuwaitense TaxID=1398745 RepID=UPI0013EAAECD|nr:DUF2929 family protein [Litoribacterium kuwaitense]NGP44558.1 DUF2929 family protein [Litoribacterium kuwaitense]
MAYLWAIVWSFLLAQMTVFVVGSMQGDAYTLERGITAGIFFAVVVLIITAFIPLSENREHAGS